MTLIVRASPSSKHGHIRTGKDRDDDCCATGGEQGTKNEPRGCKVDGYEVTADMHGTSGWGPCRAAFGQEAIYQ